MAGKDMDLETIKEVCEDDTPALLVASPTVKKADEEFVPVSQEDIQALVSGHDWPTELKIKVVDLINSNNALKMRSYGIPFIPGGSIRVENGKVIENNVR